MAHRTTSISSIRGDSKKSRMSMLSLREIGSSKDGRDRELKEEILVDDDFCPEPRRELYELVEPIGFRKRNVTVWKAYYTASAQADRRHEVAVKIIELDDLEANAIDVIRKDIQSMKECRHPNVVSYFCSFVVNSTVWIVMELMEEGSIEDIMQETKLEEDAIFAILYQVVNGLAYLHRSGRMHRDIKARHILLNSEGRVKLSDFSVSSWLLEKGKQTKPVTVIGTLAWMAPEVLLCMKDDKETGYDFRADVWSIGMTAIEMAEGHAPYQSLEYMRAIQKILDEKPPELQGDFSKNLKEFVSLCLRKNVSQRPTAEELLKIMKEKYLRTSTKDSHTHSHKSTTKLLKKLVPLQHRLVKRRKNCQNELLVTGEDGCPKLQDFISVGSYPSDEGLATYIPSMSNQKTNRDVDDPTDTHISDDEFDLEESPHRKKKKEKGKKPEKEGSSDKENKESKVSPKPSPSKSAEKGATKNEDPESNHDDFQEDGGQAFEKMNMVEDIFEMPISVHLGELPDCYVLYLRTVRDTELEFRLSEQKNTFTIVARVPPLPLVEGSKMISVVKLNCEKVVKFPRQVAPNGVTKVQKEGTMIIKIQKK